MGLRNVYVYVKVNAIIVRNIFLRNVLPYAIRPFTFLLFRLSQVLGIIYPFDLDIILEEVRLRPLFWIRAEFFGKLVALLL